MTDATEVAQTLVILYREVLAAPLLQRGDSWADDWPGWKRGVTWKPESLGVYVLWPDSGGIADGVPPIYVGEGGLGPRVWWSFLDRPSWRFARMLTHTLISGETQEATSWRRLLERYLIVVLQPQENRA